MLYFLSGLVMLESTANGHYTKSHLPHQHGISTPRLRDLDG